MTLLAPAVTYEDLLEVATNLRWTWKIDARRLFAALDPTASPGALEWPQQLLLGLGRDQVNERLGADPEVAKLALPSSRTSAVTSPSPPRPGTTLTTRTRRTK